MEYDGRLVHDGCIDVRHTLDNTVLIEENVRFCREIPKNIYNIDLALKFMKEDEINKLVKYIMRITNNRLSLILETNKASKTSSAKKNKPPI